MAQSPSHDMDDAPEQPLLSRSNTSTSSKDKARPKSRGSTTSLQSVGVGTAFQPSQQQDDSTMPLDQNGFYVQHGPAASQVMYGPNPEEMLLQYQHNMAQMQHHQSIERGGGMPQQQHEIRPMSQHAFQDVQHYPMQYPNGMPQYPVHPQHMHHHIRHQSEQFEGSPAPDDSNNENGGAKRRKGTASSLANDQELRRLLAQYQGKTLKEVASEVQKNEGSGGKSEKAKQVFAMLWLQESCQRSNNSVRRDRVFARYTEKCGNERVPTLNPASFGKLVRIIFPNVQTRRLGVRGESKYHYVDLSLFPEDDDRQYTSTFDRPGTASEMQHDRRESTAEATKAFPPQVSTNVERPPSRATVEIADFPAPSASFLPLDIDDADEPTVQPQVQQPPKMDCRHMNTPTIRISLKGMATNLVTALPSIRPNLPATMSTYLAMPTNNSLSQSAPSPQDNPIELPDIRAYLSGTTYDPSIAKALFHLYRSYCIDVIDAFRKCKEKPFFNHHSAFNGKMTVPVSKLFSMECLAPWIQECDMRMYKQIVRFIAPLALQNVPDMVWGVFDRIASKLVTHLITAFEEKCPVHVVVAKAVPAARFANLLKKLKGANSATLQMSRMLEDPHQRTQMWLDLMAMVEPERLLDESVPPPESLSAIQGMLKHDIRNLVSPIEDELVTKAETDKDSAYATLLLEPLRESFGVLSYDLIDQPLGLLEKWISWLEHLPQAFQGHHPQCMIDWHTKFWRSLMMQIGQGGAHSYQAWWFVEAFATQMLGWMTQMQGLLLTFDDQKKADDKEQEKKRQDETFLATAAPALKRKRSQEQNDEEENAAKRRETSSKLAMIGGTRKGHAISKSHVQHQESSLDVDDEETDAEMDELRRGGPLDLPSIHTGFSSPLKRLAGVNAHDDSGIDLGLDVDAEAETEAKKFNKRDWLLSSDPVDVPAGMGVAV